MSPSTISYGLMTLTLGSMTVFAITNAEALTDPFRDTRVFASAAMTDSQPTIILPAKSDAACLTAGSCCDAKPSSGSAIKTEAKVTLSPAVAAGMSAADVRTTLGEPDSISADGARWTYGSSIFIFNGDRLAGQVSHDPVQAALNKYNHVISTLNASPNAPAAKSTGPKVLTAKARNSKLHSKHLNRPIPAGSARQAYRYDRNQKEYSYYMNRSGPMDRIFTGKRFLPRGMMNSTERNLGQSYLNYGAARYSNTSSTQYRR